MLYVGNCKFNQVPIRAASLQIAFTFVVYPSLILAYMGQAAYLSKHHVIQGDYHIGFYVSVPGKYFAPLFDSLFFSFLFLFVHLNAACISSLNISTNLYVHHCPRKTAVSCSGYCYTCCSGWKPGHHHWDVFYNQAMFCFGLLPKGQNSTYIVQNPWPDLHSRDKLDVDVAMLGSYYWLP